MTKQGVRRFFMLWIQAAIRIEQRLEPGTHRLHQRVRQNGRINPQILESDLESLNSLRRTQRSLLHEAKAMGLGHRGVSTDSLRQNHRRNTTLHRRRQGILLRPASYPITAKAVINPTGTTERSLQTLKPFSINRVWGSVLRFYSR